MKFKKFAVLAWFVLYLLLPMATVPIGYLVDPNNVDEPNHVYQTIQDAIDAAVEAQISASIADVDEIHIVHGTYRPKRCRPSRW